VEKEAFVCPLFSILVLVLELLSFLYCSCAKAAAFTTTVLPLGENLCAASSWEDFADSVNRRFAPTPNRHTKFVETTHAVFLESEMVRGSMVPRQIDLEEKWVHVPTPMIQELVFLPRVVPTPAV
jgi:hypothetical protein